jgi:hypothetical protein
MTRKEDAKRPARVRSLRKSGRPGSHLIALEELDRRGYETRPQLPSEYRPLEKVAAWPNY